MLQQLIALKLLCSALFHFPHFYSHYIAFIHSFNATVLWSKHNHKQIHQNRIFFFFLRLHVGRTFQNCIVRFICINFRGLVISLETTILCTIVVSIFVCVSGEISSINWRCFPLSMKTMKWHTSTKTLCLWLDFNSWWIIDTIWLGRMIFTWRKKVLKNSTDF